MYTTGNTDTYGTLYSPQFGVISRNDNGGIGRNFEINGNLVPGKYYLELRGHDRDELGAYSLTIKFEDPSDDHGNTPDTATLLKPPSITAGYIGYAGDEDYFRIDVGAAARIVAYTLGVTNTAGVLYRGHTPINSNDEAGEGKNFKLSADVRVGDYYIKVWGPTQRTISTGPYSLVVEYDLYAHEIPLFVADEGAQQGFVRITNHSYENGGVHVFGTDDSGLTFGPVSIPIDSRQTIHLNSRDLEQGNPSKETYGSLGDGMGHWRLYVESYLDIETAAYIRTQDGLLSSVHDTVHSENFGGWRRAPDIVLQSRLQHKSGELAATNQPRQQHGEGEDPRTRR